MTQGQHNSILHNFYKECIGEAKKYLESKYPLEPCDDTDEQYPENIKKGGHWIVWKIIVDNSRHPLNLLVAIPKIFPDELPKIYLSKKDYLDIRPIPHVDKNRLVCTRDTTVAVINEDKPGEAVDQLVTIAVEEIINKGLRKENIADYVDEFLAYWNDEAEYRFLSLFSPGGKIEKLQIIRLSKAFLNSNWIFASSEEEVKKWLSPFKIEIDKESIYDSLYLPLQEPISLPQNKIDFYKIIKTAGKSYLSAVGKYFSQRDSNLFILFSFPLKQERILAGWSQTNPTRINGFRGGSSKIPLNLKMINSDIKKIRIERIDKERLFNRGGVGIKQSIADRKIALIGCGSLGSHLAISLSKTGISKFLLVDNECVEPENVARHVCGFFEAGFNMPKSEAIKDRLLEHFPHIECIAYNDDILDLLHQKESFLNNYDLIIVALANMSIERRLNFLLRKGVIAAPLLFLWLEPYGVAGQILYIHPINGCCYQCCLDYDGEFLYSVAKSNEEFYKREAGCQSTFVPYSNLEIEYFTAIAGKKIIGFLEDQPKVSILYTWLGNLAFFKSLGYQIKDEWFADLSYSIHEKIISQSKNCKICQHL